MSPERTNTQIEFYNPRSVIGLRQILKSFSIPLYTWGNSAEFTKTPRNLLREIQDGESTLENVQSEEGESLKRRVSKVALDVLFNKDGELLRLFQVYTRNGRIKRRGVSKDGERTFDGLMGKIVAGEDPESTALRELTEEVLRTVKNAWPESLSEEEASALKRPYPKIEERISDGYPGLLTEYTYYRYIFILPERFFVEEGYKSKDENGFPIDLRWEPAVKT